MSPERDRDEHAEHGVRGRVIACRRRLRQTRAGHKASSAAAAYGDPSDAGELLKVESADLDGDEFGGAVGKANADLLWSERHR